MVEMMTNSKSNKKIFIFLHIILVIYSLGSLCSKTASSFDVMSMGFILCYMGLFLTLGIYAIGWQQVIKRLPLTVAFANKAITVVWGIVWGRLFFRESISIGKIVGAIIVIAGIMLYANADKDVNEEQL